MRSKAPEITISDTTYDEMRDRYHVGDENFALLRGDKQTVVERTRNGYVERAGVWNSDYVRELYVQSTIDLIDKLDGSDEPAPDVVFWMDKSARPVSWLVDAFWDEVAAEGAEKPKYEFLNFERADWFRIAGQDPDDYVAGKSGSFDANAVPEEYILRIRALYSDADITEDNWQEVLRDEDQLFAGKALKIIDEVMSESGATLTIAKGVLRRAFPHATISADHFWSTGRIATNTPGLTQMESGPIWYQTNTVSGRGVGDTDPKYYEMLYEQNPSLENFRKKLGACALSRPLEGTDTLTDQLKQDIAYLTYTIHDDEGKPHSVFRSSKTDKLEALSAAQSMTSRDAVAYRKRQRENRSVI